MINLLLNVNEKFLSLEKMTNQDHVLNDLTGYFIVR